LQKKRSSELALCDGLTSPEKKHRHRESLNATTYELSRQQNKDVMARRLEVRSRRPRDNYNLESNRRCNMSGMNLSEYVGRAIIFS